MNDISHAGLAGYLLRARLKPERRPDRAVVLVFDATLRVSIEALNRGDLGLRARVAAVPEGAPDQHELFRRALELSGSRSPADASTLALRDAARHLELQQRIGADVSADEFEDLLTRYLNTLVAWRASLGAL